MSQDEVLTGKAKKAKRSEERHKKGKKRKQEDTATDADQNAADNSLPAGLDAIEGENLGAGADKEKSSKKRKRSGEESGETGDVEADRANDAPSTNNTTAEAKQPKKRRKNKTGAATTETGVTGGEAVVADGADGAAAAGEDATASKQRFIVFIGNLPFTATTETVTAHFASIQPTSIRHLTEPGSKKSKGFAFLEFANYDRMKTCLKLYHHSIFDSGVGGEKGKRRINVELTAGGGGAGKERKEKLKVKNTRLEEQRQRRAETLAKQEDRKAKKTKGAGGKDKKDGEDGGVKAPDEAPKEATEGMHPARLAMMKKGR